MTAGFGQRGLARIGLIGLALAMVVGGAATTFMYLQVRQSRFEAIAHAAEADRQLAISANLKQQLADLQSEHETTQRLADVRRAELERGRQQLEQSARASESLQKQLEQLTAENEANSQRAAASEHSTELAEKTSESYRGMFDSAVTKLYNAERKKRELTAQQLLDQVSARYKKHQRMPPEALGELQHELAWLYGRIKDYEGAETFGRLAVATRQESLAQDDPETLRSMSNLAAALKEQGKLAAAINQYRQLVELSEARLGAEDESTLRALTFLAECLLLGQHYEELERVTDTIGQRTLGKGSRSDRKAAFYLDWRARALQALARHSEAERLLRQLLELNLRELGPDHRNTFDTRCRLAWVLHEQGRGDEAVALHAEVTDLAEFMKAISQPYWSDTYGGYLTSIGAYDAAEECLIGNYEGRVHSGDRGLTLDQHIRPLIDLYQAWGKPEVAARYRAMMSSAAAD